MEIMLQVGERLHAVGADVRGLVQWVIVPARTPDIGQFIVVRTVGEHIEIRKVLS